MIRIQLVICLILTINLSIAQVIRINDQTSLNNAISNAEAGDTILIENNNSPYSNLEINIKKVGTSGLPIVIKAETTGGVLLTGNSQIQIGGSFIYVEGLSFGGNEAPDNLLDNGVIEFRSSTSSSDWCYNCKIKDITFDAHNQSEAYEDQVLKWVRIYGQDNEVHNCSFINKKGVGNCITVERSAAIENRALIHHNYFAGRIPIMDGSAVLNDQDAIRVGYSGTSLTDANCEIYNNFFHNWNGEAEIISSKSNRNKYYNNTFRNCVGTLTLRHGTHNEVYSNWFFGEGLSKSGGIRVIDSDHRIYNNYFQDLNSGTSKVVGAINLFKGDDDFVIGGILSSYAICENVLVAHNTIVNCDKGIWIGPDDSGREYEPRDLEISNNIMIECDNAVLIGDVAPSGSNIIQGNIKKDGIWWSGFETLNNKETTLNLTTGDGSFERITASSEAIGYAFDISNFTVSNDITSGNRDSDKDSGAEEYGSNGINRPYTINDIGILIGARIDDSSNIKKTGKLEGKLKLYPNPAGDLININHQLSDIQTINIYTIEGKRILQKSNLQKNKIQQVDISSFNPGIYFVEIKEIKNYSQSGIFLKK